MTLELEVFPGLLATGIQIYYVRLPRDIGREKTLRTERHCPWLPASSCSVAEKASDAC
jgi:hypothetical protein